MSLLYATFALSATLWVGLLFADSMRAQLFLSAARAHDLSGELRWSAPLDDVFIHFDFARSTARGAPFQWIEGNGYSSGGTSLLYPFALAVGYLAGFEKTRLMVWALVVASISVFGTLLATTRLFQSLPAWTRFLAPPFFLGVGALSWSLFSGMEVALYLGIWGLCLVAWDHLYQLAAHRQGNVLSSSLLLGGCLAALIATRPESVGVVAVFSLMVGSKFQQTAGWRRALGVVLCTAVPAALVLVAQTTANYLLTGSGSAAGALAKLEINDPKLSGQQVWALWQHHVDYQVTRLTEHHVSSSEFVGWGLWALAAVPFCFSQTRRFAVLLWLSATCWTLTVALNGQVIWQNDRYSMPALAWVLLAAAMGLGVALSEFSMVFRRRAEGPARRALRVAFSSSGLGLTLLLAWYQVPCYRDQVWFFGRASRNIHDQHMVVGERLREAKLQRVLLGDAGAIPYVGDIPALDIIGLGGYRGMPFARAQRWGVGASIELLQDIPDADRPDVMALYPTWWREFPLWFGAPLFGVSVRGNVICGGHTKMVYRPDWSALVGTDLPTTRPRHHRVIDSLDFANVTSEDKGGLKVHGATGHVSMKLLTHPNNASSDLWDAGRVLTKGSSVEFSLTGLAPLVPAILVIRTAPTASLGLQVAINGVELPVIQRPPSDEWQEISIDLGREQVSERLQVQISATVPEVVLYHLWALQK